MSEKTIMKRAMKFEEEHKIISFFIFLFLTIIVVRVLVIVKDLNPTIAGFELHHFYYGLALLIIISLLMLFKRSPFVINLPLVAIALGLIIDELVFIGMKTKGTTPYSSTISSVILFALVIALLVEFIFYRLGKKRR